MIQRIDHREVTTEWRGLSVSGVVSTEGSGYMVDDIKVEVDGLDDNQKRITITVDASDLYDTKTCEEIEEAIVNAAQGD